MAKKVIVECNPDELLVMTLGLSRKEVAHQNSKGEVCNYQSKTEIKIAIVDEDPNSGQPKYFQNFTLAEERFGIKKLVHPNNGKIILIIRPRLEEWVLAQCEQSNINPEDFFLPNDPKHLKDVINLRLNHFGRLINALKQRGNNGLNYLQSEIQHS